MFSIRSRLCEFHCDVLVYVSMRLTSAPPLYCSASVSPWSWNIWRSRCSQVTPGLAYVKGRAQKQKWTDLSEKVGGIAGEMEVGRFDDAERVELVAESLLAHRKLERDTSISGGS